MNGRELEPAEPVPWCRQASSGSCQKPATEPRNSLRPSPGPTADPSQWPFKSQRLQMEAAKAGPQAALA